MGRRKNWGKRSGCQTGRQGIGKGSWVAKRAGEGNLKGDWVAKRVGEGIGEGDWGTKRFGEGIGKGWERDIQPRRAKIRPGGCQRRAKLS